MNNKLWRKRAFDLVAGSVLALAALPLIITFAFALMVSLRAWPFFAQERVGKHGRPFKFWKLRTLPASAPQYADKYEIAEIRVPWLARIIRAQHLDELPQLFLVVLGKMSLVGPRPEMRCLHEAGDKNFAFSRISVRPGCTGLWQTSVGYDRLIWESPEFDLFYLSNTSIRFDLWILWRTALVMLKIAGPVSLDDVPQWVGRGEPLSLLADAAQPGSNWMTVPLSEAALLD